MAMFQKWLEKRRLSEEIGQSPVDNFKFGDEGDFADDYEHVREELFKAVLSKYPDETINFFNTLAQRGDPEVASLLRKLQKDKPSQMAEPRHPSDNDEVVPSSADRGGGEFSGGE